MRSYLSLIPISAKVRRRQNRLTILCIVFAVFMVTAVFSMAEMGVRMEQGRLQAKHQGLSLQDISGSAMGQSLFVIAAVLFILVLIAGVLMISSSLNSTVSQRTQFFGMMRCLGMSRSQIIRFVRLEALNWCKLAVPAGVGIGIAVTWGFCAILRFLVREEFEKIPLFGISGIGIVSGVVVGIVTVLIAARSPAKRAAKVPPAAAVSGSAVYTGAVRRPLRGRFFRVDTALGIRHAVCAKKKLLSITASFALSIILFLSFSVLIDFVGYLMPQPAGFAELQLSSRDGTNSIDRRLAETISKMDGVKRVYGRRSSLEISAGLNNTPSLMDLVSFDEFDLQCLEKDKVLKKGSVLTKVYGNSRFVLAAWDPYSPWKIGDTIQMGSEKLEIVGLLKYDPFNSDGLTKGKLTLIASGETFVRLTGESDYSILQIQTENDVTEKDVAAIRQAAGSCCTFSDKRDQSTSGTYLAFVFCVYGFLAIITLVTILNIVNSISMSVSARIKQYGAMRAVGMDGRQVTKMIAAEAFTYAFWGCAAGCAAGLPLSKLLYGILITAHFRYALWSFPTAELSVILLFVIFAAIAAVYAPARRMGKISVTETISER